MVTQVFLSHTKLDKDCCDRFDRAAPRVGLRIFRSEFENLQYPEWKTIKEEIDKSSALFLLVGKELVNSQTRSETNTGAREKWKFTQNWIAYEIGVACQLGIDVWVMCDSVTINFPVPYLNNYEIWGIQPDVKSQLEFIKAIFTSYVKGYHYPADVGSQSYFQCPHCKAVFNLQSTLPKDMETNCPTCLRTLKFPEGWAHNVVAQSK